MQHLDRSGVSVLYIGRTVLKGETWYSDPQLITSSQRYNYKRRALHDMNQEATVLHVSWPVIYFSPLS